METDNKGACSNFDAYRLVCVLYRHSQCQRCAQQPAVVDRQMINTPDSVLTVTSPLLFHHVTSTAALPWQPSRCARQVVARMRQVVSWISAVTSARRSARDFVNSVLLHCVRYG